MAVFQILTNANWDTYDALSGGDILSGTARAFIYVSNSGFKITLHGTGFTYDASGIPTGGIVTGLDIYQNDKHFAVYSGLSASLVDYAREGLGLVSGAASALTPDITALYARMRAGDDEYFGSDQGRSVWGFDGNDTFHGGTGDDWFTGGKGVDSYFGGGGHDGIFFDDGTKALHAVNVDLTRATGNILDDGYGNVETATGFQKFEGAGFRDRMVAGAEGVLFMGMGGGDAFYGGAGDDTFEGGAGLDYYIGGGGINELSFGDSPHGVVVNLNVLSLQHIVRNDGYGNAEDADGFQNVFGSTHWDRLTGNAADNVLWGNAGLDTLTGGQGNDALYGGDDGDYLVGGSGNDEMAGGKGTDRLEAGVGFDTLGFWDVDSTGHGVKVDISRASGQVIDDGYGTHENALDFECVAGSDFGDTLTGNSGMNYIWGNAGNDSVSGGGGGDEIYGGAGRDLLAGDGGSDTLWGGAGIDTLIGGAGDDIFAFGTLTPRGEAGDHIKGFTVGVDAVQMFFGWAPDLAYGHATTAQFLSGAGVTAATTVEQRVIYDTATGRLYFDSDGNGAAASVLIATIDNHALLTAQSIIFSNYY